VPAIAANDYETLIRWAPIEPELHPLPVCDRNGDPVPAEWIGITKASVPVQGRRRPLVGYVIVLASRQRQIVALQQCDTLRIALEQAPHLIGADLIRWHRTTLGVPADGTLPDPRSKAKSA
jgi:hypothetical protein